MINTMQVFLDLDSTLILSTEFGENISESLRRKSITIPDMNYHIFERPGLQPFLDALFAIPNIKVSVWTAASKDYGLEIIERFILTKPERKLQNYFYSYHCEVSKTLFEGNQKHLKTLSNVFNIKRDEDEKWILIDDLVEWSEGQKDDVINIKPLDPSETLKDNVLKDTMTKLKEKLYSL